MYRLYLKRAIDIILSSVLVISLSPVWLVVSLLITLESKGGVFFRQERLGFHGCTFDLIKFRTMKINKSRKESQVFQDHPDITQLGKILRRFKIDETPQLINVLLGHMSLIGPRPCLPTLRDRFDENGELRLTVKPGLSGWAQVNGNIYNSWEKRWEYDAYYAKNLSFLLDVEILFRTVSVVILGEEKK